MKRTTVLIAALLAAAFTLTQPARAANDCWAKSDDGSKTEEKAKPDNSKANKEMNRGETADQQGQGKADVDMTKQIRKAVVHDKTLSTYAHNVKVITKDGKVTLRGPVRSAEEKKTIAGIAAKIAGKKNVTNELEIAAKEKKESKDKHDNSEKQ